MTEYFRDDGAELLTSEEVVQRLVAVPSLRAYATRCVLPAVLVDNEWRFRRSDLEQWIEGQLGNKT
jgi:hypothetical protein